MEKKPYLLPQLEFGYKDLEPFISEAQLQLHHQKHHAAYVNGANAILETLDKNRKDGVDGDAKALAKAFSFNAAGLLLHALFWENLAPAAKTTPKPAGKFAALIDSEFGSFERFKKEFSQTAIGAEGSGWADRKAQHQRHPHVPRPAGPRRLGTRLLPGLQERARQVRRGFLEHHQLAGSQQPPGSHP
jgi:superoxide dismutase